MKSRIGLFCLFSLLSACGSPEAPSRVSSTETQLYAHDLVDGRREFERAVVGHRFRGDGTDLTVAPDGVLIGTQLGHPFIGSWTYRRGVFCVSMGHKKTRRAPDKSCYRAAVIGDTVHLAPFRK